MLECKVCGKELIKWQKSTCSRKCRNEYLRKLNTGRPSPFKGKKRWTEEQKKRIGESQLGKILSEEHRRKISEANKGQIPWMKGKTHSQEARKKFSGSNNGNWVGGKSVVKRKEALRRYNLSIEDYDKLLKRQKGVCAICGNEEQVNKKYLSVDHDHSCCNSDKSCGKCIRGLLCHKCNLGLSMFNDDIKLLEKAVLYLIK